MGAVHARSASLQIEYMMALEGIPLAIYWAEGRSDIVLICHLAVSTSVVSRYISHLWLSAVAAAPLHAGTADSALLLCCCPARCFSEHVVVSGHME